MSNLIHYFSSFDKLMKEKLVTPLFWLLIIYFGLGFLSEVFDRIGFDILDNIIDFVNLFIGFLAVFVTLRLLCELAVAIFRINDNLSPDHGVSELADIDPVAEARRAAEDAARRARLAADQAMERTQSVTRRAVDSTKATVSKATSKTSEVMEDIGDKVEDAAGKVKAKATGLENTDVNAFDSDDAEVPPIATLRPAAKKTARTVSGDAPVKRGPGRPKGSTSKPVIDPKTGQRLKKDGTPYKKPGPKPKATSAATAAKKAPASTPRKRGRPKGSKNTVRYDPVTGQRLKKDGTPARKPGPKPKS